MTGLTRTPKPIVKTDSMDAKMQQRIYLGHPCRGRLYHLITTLLKQVKKVLCRTSVGSILWKRGKDNEMQKVGSENLTYMQKLEKMTFTKG
jgi:hypothetical protein